MLGFIEYFQLGRIFKGWASRYIEMLLGGEVAEFRPRGNSMSGKIESGQLCTVEPVGSAKLSVGDIVLCKVNGREYLHLIKAIQGERYQIGNNRGRINGWVSPNAIFGRCVHVGEKGKVEVKTPVKRNSTPKH